MAEVASISGATADPANAEVVEPSNKRMNPIKRVVRTVFSRSALSLAAGKVLQEL